MFRLIVLSCILVFVKFVSATTFVPMQPPAGCTKDGKHYSEGASFQPSPCEHCYCQGGRVMCAIADCFITPCVDPVHDPTKCCPQCPNGRNCYAGNKIIPAGKDVQIDDNTICRCPIRFGFGMTLHRAQCAHKMETQTVKVIN